MIAFLVYLKTQCPTIYVGDSGELMTAANCLGIPHPPGYAIFVLLLKLASFLFPFGSFAQRSALASAIFGASSVFLVYRLSLLVGFTGNGLRGQMRFAGVGAAVSAAAFAVSLTFWSQTTIAEVYTLSLLFALMLLFVVFLWERGKGATRENRLLLLAAFLGGLGLSSHHTVALLLAALVVYVVFREPRVLKDPGLILGATLLGLLGASVHFYLVFRASTGPILNWGDARTFQAFWSQVLRKAYGSPDQAERTLTLFMGQSRYYLGLLLRQFTPILPLFSIIGAAILARRREKRLILLIGAFLLCSLFFILYTNFRLIPRDKSLVEVFFIPSFAIAAILAAPGIAWLFDRLSGWRLGRRAFSFTAAVVMALVIGMPLCANYFYCDKSRNLLSYDYGMNVIRSMPEDDTVVLVDRDMEVFTLLFLKHVEGIEPGLEMIDRSGILRRDFYPENIRLMDQQQRKGAQLKAEHVLMKSGNSPVLYVPGVDLGPIEDFALKPIGLGSIAVPPAESMVYSDWERAISKTFERRGIDDPTIFKDYTSRCVAMVREQQLGDSFYAQGNKQVALRLYRIASDVAGDIMIMHKTLAERAVALGEKKLALDEYRNIAELRPNDHLVRFNIGVLLQGQGRLEEAAKAFGSAERIEPNFPSALKSLVNIYLELGDYDNAVETAGRLRDLSPANPEANRNLGVVFELAGRQQEALAAFEVAVARDPTYALVHADIGFLREKMGDMSEASNSLRRALALEPSLAKRDGRFAKSELGSNIAAEMQDTMSKELEGLSVEALRAQKDAAIASGNLSQAIQAYRRIIEIQPNDAETIVAMGVLLDKTGASDEAESAFRRAIALAPNSAEAHNALGVAYAKRKDYKSARKEWEAALRLKPESQGTISNLKQLKAIGY
ncbi:tetratricopeptide repeat protein [bacterium]|nr:tetratricopeptide repeat protein [bacterium]